MINNPKIINKIGASSSNKKFLSQFLNWFNTSDDFLQGDESDGDFTEPKMVPAIASDWIFFDEFLVALLFKFQDPVESLPHFGIGFHLPEPYQ